MVYRVSETPAPYTKPDRPKVESPEAVYTLCKRLSTRKQEEIHVLLLDARHALIKRLCVARGGLNAANVEPRELFRNAVKCSAAAVIVVHNHPSGDPDPSSEDRRLTSRLHKAGELLGITVLDHLVIAKGGYVSVRERGFL